MIKSLILKIRLWNPKYFINPFYSPSLDGIRIGGEMVKLMAEAIEGKHNYKPISFETWEQIERSARAVFLFDKDAEL